MFVGRGTIPANFLDSVSSGMRLITPLPHFAFARLAMGGRLQFAALNAGQQTVQQFVSMAGGGQPAGDLDMLVRSADIYPGAVIAKDEFGKDKGDTIKLRRDVFTGGGYDLASRRVAPGKPTSTTGQAFTMEEVPLILEEYEGPYNTTASAVQPYQILEFDAKYRRNKDQLTSLTTKQLTYDHVKWLDTVARDLFRATSNITYADDVANVLSFTAGAGHGASLDMLLKGRKALSDREWPQFPNGNYLCLVPTAFNVQMVGDPDWRALSAFKDKGKNMLFGYITSVQDVDIFECTTLKTYAAGETVPGDGNAVPSGATVYEALLFGPGCVGMGTGQEPEARFADDTDYGKSAKVIWNSKQAFSALDTRGVQRILFQA